MILLRVLWALLVVLAAPAMAQDAVIGPPAPDVPAVAEATLDYGAWMRTAIRTETISENQRGSAFALERLRGDLVDWRDRFLIETQVNAARIGTVQAQIAALGPVPDGGIEDQRVVDRRSALNEQLARLRAPILLAEEAYAHADGLVGEVDRLIRSRQARELMTRAASPLHPSGWPEAIDGLSARALGLWKEVTVSVQSPTRLATLRQNWPAVVILLAVGVALLVRGRRWMRELDANLAQSRARGVAVWRFLISLGQVVLPMGGIVALTAAVTSSGLFGFRLTTLAQAAAPAGLFILTARWLAGQFFSCSRSNPAPFDFDDRQKAEGARLFGRLGWVLGLAALVMAFLRTSEVTAVLKSVLLLPFEVGLSYVLFRVGRLLARSRSATAPEAATDAMRLLRRLVMLLGRAAMAVAIAVPILSLVGFARASEALLYPAIFTLGLAGGIILLQWLVHDVWSLLLRSPEGTRDALAPVLIGFAMILAALPPLALIWGARWEDLAEIWSAFQEGFAMGETRVSPSDFASFVLVFGIGFMLTRLVQSTLRTTVLPKTKMDIGGQNAVVSGLGYVGIFLAALFAITSAGLDLSNLAIVAGALSVGIGFGLQNIVSNFVAGIILLIERPISQGDWIEVGGRMGYVRDISVRSTRIETFDRTDVIVPNADLVSGQVVNWTRGSSVGRVIAPVSVMFGPDVDRILLILRQVAEAHPMVLLSPPPTVVLQNFGTDVMNFEIRAIVRDVNFGLIVRSEMNVAIAKRFFAEGIEFVGGARAMGSPGRTAHSPEAPAAAPAVVIMAAPGVTVTPRIADTPLVPDTDLPPGTPTPGAPISGVLTPGAPTPGAPTPGAPTSGALTPGAPPFGAPTLAEPTPGTKGSSSIVPGTSASGNKATPA